MSEFRNPVPTVDIIIRIKNTDGIVLVKRRNPPFGWALPGGFVDYGETVEQAAVREAKEETGLDVDLAGQFHVYSAPARDDRLHTLTVVFVADAAGVPVAADDAADAVVFDRDNLPADMAFDLADIVADFFGQRYPDNF